jgi:hypothetical protein
MRIRGDYFSSAKGAGFIAAMFERKGIPGKFAKYVELCRRTARFHDLRQCAHLRHNPDLE